MPGSEFTIAADQVVKKRWARRSRHSRNGWSSQRNAAISKWTRALRPACGESFAGGDCVRVKNVASTVMAVEDGNLAARASHERRTATAARHG